MFRGTTPTLYFRINNIDDLSTIKDLVVTFKNGNGLGGGPCSDAKVLNKTIDDVIIDDEEKIISLTLSQEDTMSLKPPKALVQIKFMLEDGKVCASTICEIQVENPLNNKPMKMKTTEEEPEEEEIQGSI